MASVIVDVVPISHGGLAVVSDQRHVFPWVTRFSILSVSAWVRRIAKIRVSRSISRREKHKLNLLNSNVAVTVLVTPVTGGFLVSGFLLCVGLLLGLALAS